MVQLRFIVLTALFCGIVVNGESQDVPREVPKPAIVQLLPALSTETVENSKTETELIHTPETTEEALITLTGNDTNVTDNSTSTIAPHTTIAPQTTNARQTTSASLSSSTTAVPTSSALPPHTSTTKAPTTTPKPIPPTPKLAPGPLPPPKQGAWNYTQDENSNVSCIMVKFAAQLNVTYTNIAGNLTNVMLNVPENATVLDGSCATNSSEEWLVISWPGLTADGNATTNNITLWFHSDFAARTYELKSLNLSLAAQNLPNSTFKEVPEMWHNKSEWSTPVATSYVCAPATQVKLSADHVNAVTLVTLSQLQVEAFRTKTGKTFSTGRSCGSSDVPDAVPIAVGCALGALVLVVLAAYLVARRRSAARGYLSM